MSVQSVSAGRRQKVSQLVRDQIVIENLSLVKAIAIRVHESLPVHVDLDDLVHAGVLGLFDARSATNRAGSKLSTTPQKSPAARAYSSMSAPKGPERPGCRMNEIVMGAVEH